MHKRWVEYFLGSSLIRKAIEEEKIKVDTFEEDRIQPNSLDTRLGDEAFILDVSKGSFRPESGEDVYESLCRLPRRQRRRVSLEGGHEFKTGSSYLVPLDVTVKLGRGESLHASAKSSAGRVFLDQRLFADGTSEQDRVIGTEHERERRLWTLITPQAFNCVVRPGDSLLQVRLRRGEYESLDPSQLDLTNLDVDPAFFASRFLAPQSAELNSAELRYEMERNPILHWFQKDGLKPAPHEVVDDLSMRVDLSGKDDRGFVALRARHNPEPIDLARRDLNPAQYFEAEQARNEVFSLQPGEHYLMVSKEYFKMPPNLCGQMRRDDGRAAKAKWDDAGFFDGTFQGKGVLEVTSNESTAVPLRDGDAVCSMQIFRVRGVDKEYGQSGNNYQGQVGIRVPKFFTQYDFREAEKATRDRSMNVLTVEAKKLLAHQGAHGFQDIEDESVLETIANHAIFHPKFECERDELVIQPVPYVLVFGPDRTVLQYVRADNPEGCDETRLMARESIGVGTHLLRHHGPEHLTKAVRDLLNGQKVSVDGQRPVLVGTLYTTQEEVDARHFGLVYGMMSEGRIKSRHPSIGSCRFVPIESLDPKANRPYETWTRLLIPELSKIYDQLLI